MKMIIDIPEKIVEWINDYSVFIKGLNGENIGVMADAIKNGTPLPKGHGRLIDADALEVSIYRKVIKYQYINEFHPDEPVYEYTNYYKYKTIENAPTIIEADKKVEE